MSAAETSANASRARQREARTLAEQHGISYQQALAQLDEVPAAEEPIGAAAEFCQWLYPGEPFTLALNKDLERGLTGLQEVSGGAGVAESAWLAEETVARIRELRRRGVERVRACSAADEVRILVRDEAPFAVIARTEDKLDVRCPELLAEGLLRVPVAAACVPAFTGAPFNESADVDVWPFDALLDHIREGRSPLPGRSVRLRGDNDLPRLDWLMALFSDATLPRHLLERGLNAGIHLRVLVREGADPEAMAMPDWADEVLNSQDDPSEWGCLVDVPARRLFFTEEGVAVNAIARREGRTTWIVASRDFQRAVGFALSLAADGVFTADGEPNVHLID